MVSKTPIPLFAIVTALAGCTNNPPATTTARVGERILLFDPAEVSEIEMTAYSPQTHSRWSARFAFGTDGWRIQGGDLLRDSDHRANAPLLMHWMDALSNLTLKETFKTIREANQIGLNSPRAAIHLRAGTRIVEISIGDRAPTTDGGLAHFAQWRSDASSPQQGIISGAALQMLEHLSSFNRMRAMTWSPYAREDLILGKSHLSEPLETALQTWTHLQVLDFLDAPEKRPKLPRVPNHKMRLEVRDPATGKTHIETYWVWRRGSRVFGRTSSRPSVVELYPKTIPTLETLLPLTR